MAQIKSITDFGIFIGLDGGIDGLVHLSDISWDLTLAKKLFATIRRVRRSRRCVLAIDSERERISLGVKQLDKDPFSGMAWPSIRKTRLLKAPSPRWMTRVRNR